MNKQITLDKQTVEALLAANVRNRPRTKYRETTFAQQMRDGTWSWDSPQATTFIINNSGDWLLDGQTRLYAIQSSGCYGHEGTLQIVPDEIAEDVFQTIDTGRARTSGGTLSALGVRNANTVAAIARIVLAYADGSGKTRCFVPSTEVNEFIRQKEGKIRALPIVNLHIGTHKRFPAGFFAGALNAVRLGVATIEEAAQFLFSALRDEGEERDPTKVLSRYAQRIASEKSGGGGVKALEELVFVTKLITAHKNHRQVRNIQFSESDIVFARSGDKTPWEI